MGFDMGNVSCIYGFEFSINTYARSSALHS